MTDDIVLTKTSQHGKGGEEKRDLEKDKCPSFPYFPNDKSDSFEPHQLKPSQHSEQHSRVEKNFTPGDTTSRKSAVQSLVAYSFSFSGGAGPPVVGKPM